MKRRHILLSSMLPAAAAVAVPSWAQNARPPAAPAGARDITWEELVPPGWDPMKEFKGLDMATLQDGDPKAQQMMDRLRKVWDQAPTNAALEGQQVRIPGFVVPLDDSSAGLKEFLLVPYFGACIHSPPPPANQIVHVLPKDPASFKSMDTVWVSGRMSTVRTDSYMGVSSYRLDAVKVEPYTAPARAPR